MMGAPRTNLIRQKLASKEARIALALDLRAQNLTNKQIARQLGVHVKTVEKYISIALARARLRLPEKAELARRRIEQELYELAEELKAAWEHSKLPVETVEMKRAAVDGKDPADWPITEAKTVRRGRIAENAYVQSRIRIFERLCALYGLDKASESDEARGGDGEPANLFQLILQLKQDPTNLPTVISEDGYEMVRGPDGEPMLPEGNGEEVDADDNPPAGPSRGL